MPLTAFLTIFPPRLNFKNLDSTSFLRFANLSFQFSQNSLLISSTTDKEGSFPSFWSFTNFTIFPKYSFLRFWHKISIFCERWVSNSYNSLFSKQAGALRVSTIQAMALISKDSLSLLMRPSFAIFLTNSANSFNNDPILIWRSNDWFCKVKFIFLKPIQKSADFPNNFSNPFESANCLKIRGVVEDKFEKTLDNKIEVLVWTTLFNSSCYFYQYNDPKRGTFSSKDPL